MTSTSVVLDLVRLYGPLALCLFVFLETSMLFPFLPSEVVVPAAAVLLVTDVPSFFLFVLAGVVGGTAGALVPFWVCYQAGLDWGGRVGSRLVVSDAWLDRGRRWFRRWGQSLVLWGRFLPVLRSIISIPAGLAEMSPARFTVFTAVGTAGFYAATGALVYYGRRESLFAAAVAVATDRPILTGLILGLGCCWLLGRWLWRRSRG